MKDRFDRIVPKRRVCNNPKCKLYNMNVNTNTPNIIENCSLCGVSVRFEEYSKEYLYTMTTRELNHLVGG